MFLRRRGAYKFWGGRGLFIRLKSCLFFFRLCNLDKFFSMLISYSIVGAFLCFKTSLIFLIGLVMPTPLIFSRLSGFLHLYRKWCEAKLSLCFIFLETAIKLRYNARNIAKFKQIKVTIGRSISRRISCNLVCKREMHTSFFQQKIFWKFLRIQFFNMITHLTHYELSLK